MKYHFFIWRSVVLILLWTFIQAFDFTNHTINTGFFYQPPPVLNQKINAGFSHTLAIKADSTLWGWGNNNKGQIGNGSLGMVLNPIQVNGLSGLTDVAGGYEHTIALKSNGTVWAFGRNSEGELGDGTFNQRTVPVIVGGGFNNVVNVAAGYYHSLAIKNNGTIWAWGRNNFGQLGTGNSFTAVAPMQVSTITAVTDAAAGEFHSVALKSDGTVWTWGSNGFGQLGNGNNSNQNIPVQVNGLSNVIAVSAGRNHTLALKGDGSVWAWGDNGYGQLGNGNTGNQNVPVQVDGLTNVSTIAAGERHSIAIKNDGTTWEWGFNGDGQLGNGTTDGNPHSSPVQTGILTTWSTVTAGTHTMAVKNDGSVWGWGNNTSGQFGDGTNSSASAPQLSLFSFASLAPLVDRPTMSPDGGNYVSSQTVIVNCGTSGATIHYTTNGTDPTITDPVIASGSGINILTGTTILKARAFKTGLTQSDVKAAVYQAGEKLMSGYSHSLAIKSDGSLWSWGKNNQGQLGNGNNGNVWSPVQLDALTNITDAAGGFEHTVALKADGTVWSWGRNSEGQLGDGTLTSHNSPGAVGVLTNVINVGAGYKHSFAIKNDGTLWAWGQNDYGQLGNGTTFTGVAATQVSTLSGLIDATGGDGFSVALKNDGRVWTWGYNGNGQLGDGTLNQHNTPVQVNIANVIAIAAGRYHTMVLKSDGTVWAWGYNATGQIGNDNPNGQSSPVKVIGISNVMAIAAGESHSLAVKNDGTIWSWGYNGQGQLGNGTTDEGFNYIPVQVGTLSTWSTVCAGTHSMAVKNDGTVWTWGINSFGQFGNGNTINSAAPQLSLFSFAILATKVERPVMNPDGGSYIPSQLVTISCSTPDAVIHYTTNGTEPTDTNAIITSGSSLTINEGITIIKARAFKSTFRPSDVKAAAYQVGEKAIAGYAHSMAIRTNGVLWSWGNNNAGQLGIGITVQQNVPVRVDPSSVYSEASGGFAHSIALKNNGTVYTWGSNSNGELGDGTLIQKPLPRLVRGLTNIIHVGAGYYHSLAIKSDGTLWTWGQNIYGQLGNGNTFSSTAAKAVTRITGVINVAAGEGHTVALKNDGTVWTWGNNSVGQLGDGTNSQRNSPIQVYGINAMAIAAGRNHTLALSADGTIWAWGNNNNGELGNGSNSNQTLPIQVSGLSDVRAIAAGEFYSMALKNDGTIWAWGINDKGQLGDGTFTDHNRPVQVLGLARVTSVSAGTHTVFVSPFTTVHLYWSSGNNHNGQLGDSTLTDKNFRVLVHFPIDENNNSIADWVEFNASGLTDTDRDGLADWKELLLYGTNPLNFDTNGDGLADGVNVFVGLGQLLADTDDDGISNVQEILNGTSPILADTDGDGVPDNLDAFPLDRFRNHLPAANPSDHTPPIIILSEPL